MSAGPFSHGMVWRVCAEDLIFTKLGDVDSVFNRASGDTHILNFLSKALLDCLIQTPMNVTELEPAVLKEIEMGTEDCPFSLIEATLQQLDDIGLVVLNEKSTHD